MFLFVYAGAHEKSQLLKVVNCKLEVWVESLANVLNEFKTLQQMYKIDIIIDR